MAALGDLRLEERGDFSRDTGQALGGAGSARLGFKDQHEQE